MDAEAYIFVFDSLEFKVEFDFLLRHGHLNLNNQAKEQINLNNIP